MLLVYVGDKKTEYYRILVIGYDEENLEERELDIHRPESR